MRSILHALGASHLVAPIANLPTAGNGLGTCLLPLVSHCLNVPFVPRIRTKNHAVRMNFAPSHDALIGVPAEVCTSKMKAQSLTQVDGELENVVQLSESQVGRDAKPACNG